MKIFRSIEDYNLNQRTILTIGTFDGVHEGHKKILNKLISSSKKKNLSSVVLTFFPHPRIILNKYNEVKMIDTLDEKIWADIKDSLNKDKKIDNNYKVQNTQREIVTRLYHYEYKKF